MSEGTGAALQSSSGLVPLVMEISLSSEQQDFGYSLVGTARYGEVIRTDAYFISFAIS